MLSVSRSSASVAGLDEYKFAGVVRQMVPTGVTPLVHVPGLRGARERGHHHVGEVPRGGRRAGLIKSVGFKQQRPGRGIANCLDDQKIVINREIGSDDDEALILTAPKVGSSGVNRGNTVAVQVAHWVIVGIPSGSHE